MKNYTITYKVWRNNVPHIYTTNTTAENPVDAFNKCFENCPQSTRNRITDISIMEG